MSFTSVAGRRNSRPSPCRGSSQSRLFADVHVRFMFAADASSTAFTPAAVPKYHIPSTSSCSASTFASASLAPVITLMTPAGTLVGPGTVYKFGDATGVGDDSTTCTLLTTAHVGGGSRNQ